MRLERSKFSAGVLPIVAAALWTISHTMPGWELLAWCALAPLAVAAGCRQHQRLLYGSALVAGFVSTLWAVDWIRTSYGDSSLWSGRSAGWLLAGVVCAPRLPLTIWLLQRPTLRGWPCALSLPLVWTSVELLTWQVAELLAGTPFPWLQLGLSQIDRGPLVQIADLGGVWLVSLLVALVSGVLADMWMELRTTARLPKFSLAVATLCLLAAHGYGCWRLAHPHADDGPRVCLMNAHSAAALLIDSPLAARYPTVRAADLLLWPEAVVELAVVVNDALHAEGDRPKGVCAAGPLVDCLRRHAMAGEVPLVVGCPRVEQVSAARYNSLVFASATPHGAETTIAWYDKVALVPGTEFTPVWLRWGGQRAAGYSSGRERGAFELSQRTTNERIQMAPLVCYDLCFPRLLATRFATSARPLPAIVLVASCESADASGALARDMQRMARWRAVEFRRPVVRNTTGGISGLIDSTGREVVALWLSDAGEPCLLPPAPLDERVSLYARWGEWVPWCCTLVVVAVLLRGGASYARSRSSNKISATNSATAL